MPQLTFREPTIADHLYVKTIWEDDETMQAVGGIHPLSIEQYAKWHTHIAQTAKDTNKYLLIFNNDICIGEVSFHHFNPKQKTARLNIKIKAQHRRQGFAKRALDFILSIFFNEWNGAEMHDLTWINNHIGYQALKHYGFEDRPNNTEDKLLVMTKQRFTQIR